MCFLILLERVVIVRKIASHLPQVGWMNSKSGEEKRLPAIWWTHSGSVAWESRNQSQEILSWGTWLTPAASQPLGKCATAPASAPASAAMQKRRPPRERARPQTRWGTPAPMDWLGKGVPRLVWQDPPFKLVCPRMPALRAKCGHYGPNAGLYFSDLQMSSKGLFMHKGKYSTSSSSTPGPGKKGQLVLWLKGSSLYSVPAAYCPAKMGA